MTSARFSLFLAGVLFCGVVILPCAGAMEEWPECVLVPWEHNDGDSFLVRAPDGTNHRIRLYFVDAPETSAASATDQRRLRAQIAHFGLPSAAEAIRSGEEAAAFAADQLARPFTVFTARATAPGRGSVARLYAFVRTADGRDLSELLVAAGLARAHGVGRATPEGVRRDDHAERLRDLELAAALRRSGAWRWSEPETLVERRAALRVELSELDALRLEVLGLDDPDAPVDPNSAPAEALQSLPGIGPALAERIIADRPYADPDDLRRVPGIGPAVLEAIRDRLWFPE